VSLRRVAECGFSGIEHSGTNEFLMPGGMVHLGRERRRGEDCCVTLMRGGSACLGLGAGADARV